MIKNGNISVQKLYFIFFGILIFSYSAAFSEDEYDFDEPKNQEEALYIRRILEFWEEGNLDLTKAQIRDFLTEFPENAYKDKLHAILGDLTMKDSNYSDAINYYSNIENPDLQKKVLLKRLECMRNLEWHQTLAEECEANLGAFAETDKEKNLQICYLLANSLYELVQRLPEDSENYLKHALHAKGHLESLLKTGHGGSIKRPLAHIYSVLGENEKASSLFMELAEKKPDEREDMLFLAANTQVEFDKEQAIQTFGQIYRIGKKRAPDAAYNRMILMFDKKRFAEIILAQEELSEYITNDKKPIVDFFIGLSHYNLDDHKRAFSKLGEFIHSNPTYQEELHSAYSTILLSAAKLQDVSSYDGYLDQFEEAFPDSKALARAYVNRALLHKDLNDFESSKSDFVHVLEAFPDYDQREGLMYEYAHLLFNNDKFDESRDLAQNFLEDFPQSDFISEGWKILIHSSIESAKENPKKKKRLIKDLNYALDLTGVFNGNEENNYLYLLAKTSFEIEKYKDTIGLLLPLVRKELSKKLSAHSYLLVANSYRKGFENHNLYCSFAEKALAQDSSMKNADQVHLSLFNSYLRLYSQNNDTLTLDKAADHLFTAQDLGISIKDKNREWLIDYYYQDAKKSDQKFIKDPKEINKKIQLSQDRALALLKKFPSNDLVEKEGIQLKLANTYGYEGRYRTKVQMLKDLFKEYDEHPEKPWKHQTEARFELGGAYERLESHEKALIVYESIAGDSTSFQSFIPAKSALQSARLAYKLLDKNFLNEVTPELTPILTTLKTLYLQKNLSNEPIHLEATLDYIDIQASLLDGIDKERKIEFLIQKSIAHFFSEEDILSKEYQQARFDSPEKEKIFLAYIDLFDLEAIVASSKICLLESKKDEANNLIISAKDLLEELKLTCPTYYYQERLKKLEDKIKIISISLDY